MPKNVNVLYVHGDVVRQVEFQKKVRNARLPWFLTFASSLESAYHKLDTGQKIDLIISENASIPTSTKYKIKHKSPLFVLLTKQYIAQENVRGNGFHSVEKDREGRFLEKINSLLEKGEDKPNNNDLKSKKILIGEDNLMNSKLILKMLEPWGLKPKIMGNGQLVVDELKKNDYDLLLIDLQMPVMDGVETIKHIRHEMQLKLKIILMTAVLFEESYTEVLPLIEGMLPKPFTAENLYSHINKCLKGSYFVRNELSGSRKIRGKEKLFDLAFLHKVSRGNMTFVKDMIDIFINQVQAFNPKIPMLIKSENVDELRLNVHTIKSSARHVGSLELSQFCEDIEGFLEQTDLKEQEIKRIFLKYQALSQACSEQLRHVLQEI